MPQLKKNILLVAHEFAPDIGSECEQGWNLGRAISRYSKHNVYICFASGNQFMPQLYVENLDKSGFIYTDKHICVEYSTWLKLLGSFNGLFVRRFGPLGFPPLFFYIYGLWQNDALNLVKSLDIDFDVVHVLNLINATSPGPWWKLAAKRYLWGPTGGLVYSTSKSMKERLRNVFVRVAKASSNYNNFVKKCTKIFVFDNSIIAPEKQIRIPESGIQSQVAFVPVKNTRTLNCCFAGHFNHRKGFDIFDKLACVLGGDDLFEFYSFGKGYIRPSRCIVNHGFVSRDLFLTHLKDMHILILPSLREGTPQVIMEAISQNVLVISTDVGGIPFFISDQCCLPYDDFLTHVQVLLKNLLRPAFFNACLKSQSQKSNSLTWENISRKIVNHYD